MWIRDALPRSMPRTRAILYGYDTTLLGSNSFQTIADLALSFIEHLRASGAAMSNAKPTMFLAHSLGGIVFKEALVYLAHGGERERCILERISGGVLFGVPSEGLENSHLLAMVQGQPNQHLIQDLSKDSEYLQDLDSQFSGLTALHGTRLYWAYETRTSPTVVV
jgi:hypothetical protein